MKKSNFYFNIINASKRNVNNNNDNNIKRRLLIGSSVALSTAVSFVYFGSKLSENEKRNSILNGMDRDINAYSNDYNQLNRSSLASSSGLFLFS